MSMQDLRIFELVASCGSMTEAGRALGICALEDRLATQLFAAQRRV